MEHSELAGLKEQAKQGSVGALRDIIEDMRTESLDDLLAANNQYEYYQSRVNVLDDIIELLPPIS